MSIMFSQMEKFLRGLILTGVFATLFLPFYVDSSMFFPFITGKGFLFRIIIEIITGAWILLILNKKESRPKSSWITYVFMAFIVSLSISTIVSENPFKSFWSNFERMEGLITILHMFAYFLVAGTMLAGEKLWTRFFNTSLIASLGVALYSLAQLAGKVPINQGGVRIDATFGNSSYLAIYFVFHVFLALFFLLRSENRLQKVAYGCLALLHIFLVYETETRGALLGLLGGLLLSALLIIWKEREKIYLRTVSWGVVGGIILLVLGFIAIKDTSFVKNNPTLVRFTNISLTNVKDQARYYVWPMAIKGFIERPIFGWGQESFNYVFNKYYDPRMYTQEQWFDRTHNIVLDWLIAGEIIGLLIYLGFFVTGLASLWKATSFSSTEKSILTGLLAAYFFQNLFVFDNLISYLLFFSVLAYIHFHVSKEWKLFAFDIKNMYTQNIISAIVIVLFLFILYTANMLPIMANKTLIAAITPPKDGNYLPNLELFKKALSYNTFGNSEIREQLGQGANSIVRIGSVPTDVKTQFADLAIKEFQKQLQLTPHDARYQIFTAVSLDVFGRYDDAIVYGTEAVKSSPGKQSMYFELGTSYLGKGDYKTALKIFKTAYELDPSYQTAKIIYTMGSIYANDTALTQQLLSSLPENTYYTDDRILQAYITKKDYQHVREILNKRITLQPNDINSLLSLAALDLQLGNRTQAVKEIQQAIQIQPQFKDQGEYYIKEIQAGRNP